MRSASACEWKITRGLMSIDAAFTEFPVLTTARLQLRQMRPSDAAAMFAIKSNLIVTTPYGQEPHPSPDATLAWMQRHRGYYEQRQALFWCITFKNTETVIGSCTFWNFDPGYHGAEIGYELHPDYWRRGIMSEAVSAALDYGFGALGLHRIEAVMLAENTASEQLVRKLGFAHEGTLRQREFFRGQFHDQLYFGMLSTEWRTAT